MCAISKELNPDVHDVRMALPTSKKIVRDSRAYFVNCSMEKFACPGIKPWMEARERVTERD